MNNTNNSQDYKHFLKHFFMKKKYSIGIYKGGVKSPWSNLTKPEKDKALKKKWYVRWSYRNPETGKMERQVNIYGNANSYTTHSERMKILKILQRNLEDLLKEGFNPYDESNNNYTPDVFTAIDKGLEIKKLHMKHSSFIRFKSDINKLKEYLNDNGFNNRFISSVTKRNITDFLNKSLKEVSPRSRNNYRTSIASLWQCLEDEGMIERNFVKTIPMLKTKPQRNKTYSIKQAEELFEFMSKNHYNLLLFIKFVSYNFLRPIEVCRLKVGSFNLEENTLTVMVKQGVMKTKIIPEILIDELPDMTGLDLEINFFGKENLLEKWDISDDAKRGSFSREFKKVKNHFGLGEEYGIYSFRHYYTTRLYNKLRETLSPYETKSKLMLITGHESMKALEKYLRSIDAELPDDYSSLLT